MSIVKMKKGEKIKQNEEEISKSVAHEFFSVYSVKYFSGMTKGPVTNTVVGSSGAVGAGSMKNIARVRLKNAPAPPCI